ncbi:LOW QUALITY PROTEIN: anaphase-promoting complex subunit 11-like [Nematostella vectensis]|uniref:LOW QUALITY PROTEIN: anaphase-promoting complex subunit 11-like n=1 Tax=Nematostella vectensis TaxID=45351 RepID=UPI00207707B7|nr:LOW QUALITY PROTEIN: anaphase-promoting complex subunit 11-like [Nematostella vectensis]
MGDWPSDFHHNRWVGVATWKWMANDDNCGICRMPFDGCCPDCKVPGDDCPLVWGRCSHVFHMHVFSSGSTHNSINNCALCVARSGSSKNNLTSTKFTPNRK